jgi:hypothetical protein
LEKKLSSVSKKRLNGGYQAKALGFPIFTEAETFEDIKKMVQDAVVCHFDEAARPWVIRLIGTLPTLNELSINKM